MNPRRNSAFTWIEALVCLAIIGVLGALALPSMGVGLGHSPMTQTLSNARQLYTATYQMALDGESTADKSLGWPGDTGGTFSHWTGKLVAGNYLRTSDVCKLLSAPGIPVRMGKVPEKMSDSALLVYAVSKNSPDNAVFLTSANFTNTAGINPPLDKSAKPYGKRGFVVFRKGGDGVICKASQVAQTNIIGSFVPLCQ